jgi:hypothetical protein
MLSAAQNCVLITALALFVGRYIPKPVTASESCDSLSTLEIPTRRYRRTPASPLPVNFAALIADRGHNGLNWNVCPFYGSSITRPPREHNNGHLRDKYHQPLLAK